MNTKNQKTVLHGFKNRIDLLGSRKAALQSVTGERNGEVAEALISWPSAFLVAVSRG